MLRSISMWLLAKEILKNIFIHASMIRIFFRIALALKKTKKRPKDTSLYPRTK